MFLPKWIISIFIVLQANGASLGSTIFLPVTALLTRSTSSTKRSHQHHNASALTRIRTSRSDQLSVEAAHCFPSAIPVTEKDRLTMQRQTGQVAPSVAALGVPSTCQCQHGYPQVFLLNPLVGEKRMNSGLLKLTCPLLVNAIDQMEDDGYIADFTKQVESNEEWKESCQTRHQAHSNARKSILMETTSLDDPMLISTRLP